MKPEEQSRETVRILSVETSCDETAAAVTENGRQVRSNIIASQIDLHTLYGGVVPELASRKHIEAISAVTAQALSAAGYTLKDMDAVAVTAGPGLVGALLTGVAYAKSLAWAAGLPLVGVHHIEGHIHANYIAHAALEPPFICLVASGGHSHLVWVKTYTTYKILGCTRDDAAGEAFDKVARALGLGYPGGPKMDAAAKDGNPNAIAFPKARVDGSPYDFSFSGVKSAVLNYINACRMKGETLKVADVAASFQKAVTEVLIEHTLLAVQHTGVNKAAIAGGVAANSALRAGMEKACKAHGIAFYRPDPVLCTDNAAMIGCAAYYACREGRRSGWDLNASPNLRMTEG